MRERYKSKVACRRKKKNPINFQILPVSSEAPRKALRSVITNSDNCIRKNWQREKEERIFFQKNRN